MVRAAWIVLGGALLEAAAVVQQLRWHAAHPDAEPFASFFLSHAGIYAGAALGALGAALAWRTPALRGAAALLFAGALARLAALALDARLHAQLADARPAHDLYRAGIALALAGAGLAAWALLRRRAPQPR